MNNIEQQIYEFIEKVAVGNAVLPEELIEEFGERCKQAVRDKISEAQEKKFTLRMSNIGRPLRQLMLDKLYGYKPVSSDFILKMLYGSFYEALTLMLLKASSIPVIEHDKKVSMKVATTEIQGTFDVKIRG